MVTLRRSVVKWSNPGFSYLSEPIQSKGTVLVTYGQVCCQHSSIFYKTYRSLNWKNMKSFNAQCRWYDKSKSLILLHSTGLRCWPEKRQWLENILQLNEIIFWIVLVTERINCSKNWGQMMRTRWWKCVYVISFPVRQFLMSSVNKRLLIFVKFNNVGDNAALIMLL